MVTQQLAGHAGENPSLTKTCTSADEIRQYIGENQKQLKEIAFNEDKKRKVLVDEALLKTLRPDDMTPEVQNVVQREVAKTKGKEPMSKFCSRSVRRRSRPLARPCVCCFFSMTNSFQNVLV